MMKLRYSILLAASVLPLSLSGQNLNPRVVVTNDYEGKVLEAHREEVPMAVPDSLTSFDWKFDYSVFDNPYKGAYEFRPYKMAMVPSSSQPAEKRFYLRGGLGYTFHPELTVAYDPLLSDNMDLGLNDRFKGYAGPYRGLGSRFSGYDMYNRLGASLRLEMAENVLTATAGYSLLAAGDTLQNRLLDAVDAGARLTSRPNSDRPLSYDFGFSFVSSRDRTGDFVSENCLEVDGRFGYPLEGGLALITDVDVRTLAGNAVEKNVFNVNLTPHLVFRERNCDFLVGVKLSTLNILDVGNILYPDLSFRYRAVRSKLYLNAEFTGGNSFLSVYDQALMSHHVWGAEPLALSEAMRVGAWIDGTLFKALQYKAGFGYRKYDSGVLETISPLMYGRQMLKSDDFSQFYADVRASLKLRGFDADASLAYTHTWDTYALAPAPVQFDAHATFNLKRRFFAGADIEIWSSREGRYEGTSTSFELPGFIDLGARFEYMVTGRMSGWLRLGNLLGDDIRKTALYAEPGLNITAGICLNIR